MKLSNFNNHTLLFNHVCQLFQLPVLLVFTSKACLSDSRWININFQSQNRLTIWTRIFNVQTDISTIILRAIQDLIKCCLRYNTNNMNEKSLFVRKWNRKLHSLLYCKLWASILHFYQENHQPNLKTSWISQISIFGLMHN